MSVKIRTNSIIASHANAAQSSQYDRRVAVTAISSARSVIDSVFARPDVKDYKSEILEALIALQSDYHDPDGEFTNGKGVLGSLIGDLASALSDDLLR